MEHAVFDLLPLSSSSSSRHRALQNTDVNDTATFEPTAFPDYHHDGFQPQDNAGSSSSSSKGGSGLGWITILLLTVIGAVVAWRLWIRYKRRVEQQMMAYRSAQADRVLGDMQMVPSHDLDNELI
jgi:hypothetical protein